ncbi:MAG: type III pantothenate kinase [Chloroflexota bacterium]|nr:type III pantothenate kinase [Chloroflexota bacterium]
MLLAVDVGNSNTVIGLCDSGASEGVLEVWRLTTEAERMPDEWFSLLWPLLRARDLELTAIQDVVVSSVVPTVTGWFAAMCRHRLGIDPLVVSIDLDLGMRALVDRPSEVGADRLVNTVAAFHRYGGPAIVIDFGTATTFDVVSAEGNFIGGAIAPGLMISLEALTGRAARLFAVDLALPESAIGTNTVTNIQSGLVLGYLAMLEGMIGRIRAELGGTATTIATGGLARFFADATPMIDHHDADLIIDGLRLIHRRVRG